MPSVTKILIVDDEEDICYFLSRNLSKKNLTTSIAHTLSDAEAQLEAEEPSIMLLDNHLPDGFGINFISKAKDMYPDMKIVMMTAHDGSQERTKAYSYGANYFLSKPFTLTEINKVVDLLTN